MEQVDRLITAIGASPYAVVMGIVLAAIPILIPTYRLIKQAFLFIFGSIRIGLKKQIVRSRYRLFRQSLSNLTFESYLQFLIRQLYLYIHLFSFSLFYVIAMLAIAYLFVPGHERLTGRAPFPMAVVLFVAVFWMINSFSMFFRLNSVNRTRRKLIARHRARKAIRSDDAAQM